MPEGARLTAPKVQHYLDWLGDIEYRNYDDDTTYDEKSYSLLETLFAEIRHIKPEHHHGSLSWSLWLRADRGPMEDFGDWKEWVSSGEVSNKEGFIQVWRDFFPDEEEWYEATLFEDEKTLYRGVVLKHKHVIEVDPSKPHQKYPYDITPFVQWLIDSLHEAIEKLKAGTYNAIVDARLPAQHRVGTIQRSDYWSVFPEAKGRFFERITKEDVEIALDLMGNQPDFDGFSERLPSMTANRFYEACALGYKENRYKCEDLAPKELYYRFADRRDEGMGELDGDSESAFHDWLCDPHRGGGHPWEVCRGGNSTHVDLRVRYDEKGYFFCVAGNAETRCIETIKFFLALKENGLPVFLFDAKELSDRLRGEERIGIVPEGVIPRYCSSWFPGEDIIDYMNLPFENREEIAAFTTWQPLEPVELAEGL